MYIKRHIKKSILKSEYTTIILTIWSKQKTQKIIKLKKKIEIKNILVYEKNYKDFTTYLTRHIDRKLIEMLCLHYHELMGNIKERQ